MRVPSGTTGVRRPRPRGAARAGTSARRTTTGGFSHARCSRKIPTQFKCSRCADAVSPAAAGGVRGRAGGGGHQGKIQLPLFQVEAEMGSGALEEEEENRVDEEDVSCGFDQPKTVVCNVRLWGH